VSVHELSVQSHHGRLRVEQHVELDEKMPLLKAHGFVSSLEAEILREAPEIDHVLTHIESEPATIEQPKEMVEKDRKIESALRSAARQFPEIVDVHEIIVGRTSEHIHLSCHCTLPDDLAMQRVHEVMTGLEDRFKLECPEVYRVTIHPEPVTDNLR
jgi:divalent metal cation (Fe/Co/Zn/Cd) transporter